MELVKKNSDVFHKISDGKKKENYHELTLNASWVLANIDDQKNFKNYRDYRVK